MCTRLLEKAEKEKFPKEKAVKMKGLRESVRKTDQVEKNDSEGPVSGEEYSKTANGLACSSRIASGNKLLGPYCSYLVSFLLIAS